MGSPIGDGKLLLNPRWLLLKIRQNAPPPDPGVADNCTICLTIFRWYRKSFPLTHFNIV